VLLVDVSLLLQFTTVVPSANGALETGTHETDAVHEVRRDAANVTTGRW
jgi:hypothetical protein